jgi:hypothetical protein
MDKTPSQAQETDNFGRAVKELSYFEQCAIAYGQTVPSKLYTSVCDRKMRTQAIVDNVIAAVLLVGSSVIALTAVGILGWILLS